MERITAPRIEVYLALRIAMMLLLMLVPVASQAQTIRLDENKVPLEKVLKSITEQTGYKFVYSGSVIDAKQLVSINVKSESISSVLDLLLKGTDITYSIKDKQIALLSRKADKSMQVKNKKERSIVGKVTFQDGSPLIGAYVIVDGTNQGASTDLNGNYSILVDDGSDVNLVFSYVGMESQKVNVGNRNQIDVTLNDDKIDIEKAVVTGYQTISKERSAGSYSTVKGSAIMEKAAATGSVLESLEGSAAGLNVNLGSEGDKYLLRGVTSINSNRTPLFIVDGVSCPTTIIESLLNGNDIESVTVLKDAVAASIWGSQAANGVVVITTKKGTRNDKVSISYLGSFTYKGKPDYSYMDMMDSKTFIKNAIEVFDPEGYPWETVSSGTLYTVMPHEIPMYQYSMGKISESERDAELQRLSGLDGRKDYEKYLMSDSWLTNHSISIQGGSNVNTYYISTSYQGQQGISKDRYDEYKVNARENIDITKWMNLDLNLNASYGTVKSHLSQLLLDGIPGATGISNLPYAVLFNTDGSSISFSQYLLNESVRKNAENLTRINLDYYPVSDFNNTTSNDVSTNIRANAGLTIKILDGLKYEGRFSYYIANTDREAYTPSESFNVRLDRVYATSDDGMSYLPLSGGYFQTTNAQENSYTLRNQLDFNKFFGDNRHQVTALVGQEISQRKIGAKTSSMRGYDIQTMKSVFYDDYNISLNGVENPIIYKLSTDRNVFDANRYVQTETTYRFVSFYANAAYTYDQRYSLNASIRVDQSNLFGSDPSVQFKPIWSLGGVWNMRKEQFMKDASWVDELSLRVSYGFSGNSPDPGLGGPYNIINAVTSPYNSEFGIGYALSTPADTKLTWEKTRTWNVGISYGILGNRLRGSFDIYDKQTSDMLSYSPIDPSTGFTTVLQNIGRMSNKGFELAFSSANISGKNFTWDTDLTLAYDKNKIEEMYFDPLTPAQFVSSQYAQGYPAGALFAYKWAGLDPTDGAARVYDSKGNAVRTYQDVDDNSAIAYMGSVIAPWSASLDNILRYKNLELSFQFIGNFGNKMRNDTYVQYDYRLTTNVNNDFDKRWRQPGDEKVTNIPSFAKVGDADQRDGGDMLFSYSDANILDASYIKLRELSLSCYLPERVCKALNTKSVKVGIESRNLWTIPFNNEGIDPESFSLRLGRRSDWYHPSISANLSIEF